MGYNSFMNNSGRISAITTTPYVQQWLGKPTAVSILHIFDQAINLIDADDEIISIVQPTIGAGPFSIVVNTGRPFSTVFFPQDAIHKTANSLHIGSVEFDLRSTKLWNPMPRWYLLREQQEYWLTLLPELATAVAQQQRRLTTGSPKQFATQFHAAAAAIQQTLAQANKPKLETAVAQLAGLGPGFTPAGDDFLLGLLLGLWATRPEAEVIELAKIVVATAVPQTTKLSAAWLKTAAVGEAILPWHALVDALLAGNAWQTPVKRILDTGATSGIAALVGFIAAAEHLRQT